MEGLGGGATAATAVSSNGSVIIGGSFRWELGIGIVPFAVGGAGISADGSVTVGGKPAYRSHVLGAGAVLSAYPDSYANAISADGAVAVGALSGSTGGAAFRWPEGGDAEVLDEAPPPTFQYSNAYGVSGNGSVIVGEQDYGVGVWPDGSSIEAFIWTRSQGMRSLRDVLVGDYGLDLHGFRLVLASAVSADGRTIVGEGANGSGDLEAWIAVFPPECSNLRDDDGDGFTDYPNDPGCSSADQNLENPQCDDGVDNDGDGLIDYPADAGCASRSSTIENPACSDGVDNDGDGLIDYPADRGCASPSSTTENPACDDGVDNDADALVDYPADPGCAARSSVIENPACDDGVDNDGDGKKDYPLDTGCSSSSDVSEQFDCQDGIDNDGDGLVDYPADPGCARPESLIENPQCNDGIDNDGDGLIDLADPQCSNFAANPREGSGCGLGPELGLIMAALFLVRRTRVVKSA